MCTLSPEPCSTAQLRPTPDVQPSQHAQSLLPACVTEYLTHGTWQRGRYVGHGRKLAPPGPGGSIALLAAGMRWGERPAFPRESLRTCLLVFREAVIMMALLLFYNTRMVTWAGHIGLPF